MAALDEDFTDAEMELERHPMMSIVSENRYQELALRYGHLFDADIGAGAVRSLLERLNVPETVERLEEEVKRARAPKRSACASDQALEAVCQK